ncbi:TonB-dependent receptor plug domain-containing protein [Roseicyclus persicicus]|uniref:TonB-dependent receptor n=1 Tax=Roseicyclus persicicus TaxID=2650661 RepID=A0A7X6H1K3_9RHOB|nr:TonB-dependent receptor [Roseibacterium persicicum]NKX45146.1 TonB-dependent receptor [Roseibacterium persicicum]
MKHHVTAALLPALLLPAVASAQTVFDLDEIVFSGAFGETTLEETGATVSVVTREELQATGETRLVDYLARLPGVDVRARGPIGGLTSITIRGAGQNYVRVLVDGIDVSDVSGPQVAFDFGSLTTADISRIELLRGGQSAVYGSEAIGGVINITTLRAEEEGVTQTLSLEAGSYDTLRGSYGVAARIGAFDYAFTLSRTQTEGFSAADENQGNTEADGFESTRLSFSLGHDLANGGRVGLNGFVEEARIEFDEQFPVGDGSPDEVSYNDSVGLRAYLELPTGPIDSTFAATWYEIERDVRGSTGFGGANNVYMGERVGLSYLGVAQVAPTTELRFGLDATRETFSQAGDFGPARGESEIFGLFGEVAWSPAPGIDVAATLRHDDHSQFGGLTSGRIAMSWRPSDDWIVRASAAQSYRAPSLYELYGPFGNAALQPEESRSVDLGVERRFGPDAFARATLFYNETTNLIDLPFIPGSPYVYRQVAGTVIRRGVELEAGAPIGAAWRIDGSYTYTDGRNPPLDSGNAWNLEFPEHDASLTLTGDLTDRLSLALSVQSVWDRPTLGDYTIAHATFTYALAEEVEAYLRIENLTDEEYQLFRNYGTSDRAVYIGLRSRF